MTFPVQIGPSTITINRDDRVLVCQPDWRILGESDGFFTRDIRFVAILCGLYATTDAEGSRLYVNPALPDWMPEIRIQNLRLGGGSLDVHFTDGVVEVLSNTSRFEVVHAPARGPLGPRSPAS